MINDDRTGPNIGVISSYLPKKCGIATFSKDLCDAIISSIDLTGQIKIIAMTDIDVIGDFDDRVIYKIQKHNQVDYISAAEFLNQSNIDLVILQHEYGLYGGENGEYIIKLLENLRIPIITTLHTVLFKSSAKQKQIIQKITALSSKIIIMNQLAKDLLIKQYSIFPEKISFIPHGIFDIPFVDNVFYKNELGLEENRIILTFGFLSPNKGIEIAIEAMPRIIEKFKNVIFIIVGQTHPDIIKNDGETYRNSLVNRVEELHLENQIIFHNKFVDLTELIKYLSAADIFITPYINADQITSGTLSYALGSGKAIISTPYSHAKELLAEDRGILVPFKNPDKIADAVIELYSSDLERNIMRKRAYQFSRSMVWSQVARMYINLFKQEFTDYHNINVISKPKFPFENLKELPSVKLDYFRKITDSTGILQHSEFSIPNRKFGYSLDDNARALIIMVQYLALYKDITVIPYINTFTAFLVDAYNYKTNRFRNFMAYDRRWLENSGSEDSHGRALWSIGFTIFMDNDSSNRACLTRLFNTGLKNVSKFKSIRSIAFILLGIHYYLKIYNGDVRVEKIQIRLSNKIYESFKKNITENWLWFEDILTYCNGKVAQALLISGADLNNQEMTDLALKILNWLLKIQTTDEGYLNVIGNHNWVKKDGYRTNFDQQPIEAVTLLEACISAYHVTGSNDWLEKSKMCFKWFLGYNVCGIQLYNPENGGCYDGLEPNRVNQNMGAESTLAWLMSLLIAHKNF